jgi:hypothetical protein
MTNSPLLSLEEIVSRVKIDQAIPEGLTSHTIYKDEQLGTFKIRRYDSVESAKTQEQLLLRLEGIASCQNFLGRWEDFLVFQFLELPDLGRNDPDDKLFFHIGKFLASINKIDQTGVRPEQMDEEVSGWLKRFVKLAFLPKRIIPRVTSTYQHLRPSNLTVCIDYWDAMPHNFAVHDENFFLLDEKHLRPSFPFVGLVKPAWFLPIGKYNMVRQGYEREKPLQAFDRHFPFFEFYYLLVALYFYSLAGAAGRISLEQNPRFLDFRERLIKTACADSPGDILYSELHFFARQPKNFLSLLRRKIRRNRISTKNMVYSPES